MDYIDIIYLSLISFMCICLIIDTGVHKVIKEIIELVKIL